MYYSFNAVQYAVEFNLDSYLVGIQPEIIWDIKKKTLYQIT